MRLVLTGISLLLLCADWARGEPPPANEPKPADEEDARSAGDAETASEPTAPSGRGQRYRSVIVGERPADPSVPVYRLDGERSELSTRVGLLERAAQELPGLYVNARGSGGYGIGPGAAGAIHLRGLGGGPNTEILVIEDGAPDLMGLFGHPIPDALPTRYLASLALVPGGDSVLYGSGAMAGVLLLQTRWRGTPGDGNDVLVAAEGGSYATVNGQAGLLGRRGRFDYLITASALHGNGHRDQAATDEQTFYLKARVRWSCLQLVLRQHTTLLEGEDPGPATRPYLDHFYRAYRFSQSLSLRHTSAWLSGFATLYGNVGLHRLYDGFSSRDEIGGLWIEERAQLARWLAVSLGVDARVAGGTAENTITPTRYGSHHTWSVGPYAQAVATPLGWLAATFGARMAWAQGRGWLPLLKGGLELRPWSGGRIFGRAVQNFREPTIVELYLPMPVANPGLKPERSLTVDFGVDEDWPGVGRATLTAFRTEAHDYIRTLGAFPTWTRANVAHAVFWGVEGALRLTLLRPFFVDVVGSYVWLGQYTAQNPAIKLDATLAYDRRPWRVAVSTEWVGGLYQNDYRQGHLDDVWFLDARVDYWPWPNVHVYLIGRNLTNHRYAFIADYPMPGINILLGLELRFDRS